MALTMSPHLLPQQARRAAAQALPHPSLPVDPLDLLSPDWRGPPEPLHRFSHTVARLTNRALMLPILALGRAAMAQFLRSAGFKRGHVNTRLGHLSYFDAPGKGSLPPVCLVLGIAGSSTDYAPMLRRLLAHFSRVLVIDLPGQGYSSKPRGPLNDESVVGAIGDGLDQLMPPRSFLLGHSLGGYLAARYACARPERVRALVLAEPLGAPFSPVELENFNRLYALESRAKARAIIHNAFWNDPHGNAVVVAAAWARLSGRQAQEMLKSDLFTKALQPHVLRCVQPPVLLVWGQDDHLLPTSHLNYFLSHLPPSTHVVRPPHVNHNNTALGPPQVIAPVVAFAHSVMMTPPPQKAAM